MIFIKDEEFIRGNCPMTKEEVRILSIAKLGLKPEDLVLDIGAGTGSVSIQMSRICSKGKVIGIEKDREALEVLYKNKEKFQAHNFEIIEGEAMEVDLDLCFDAIFIGGSGGGIEQIIEKYGASLKAGGKMVLNFITIDNLYRALDTFKKLSYKIECSQVAVNKAKGKSLMLMANNPIFIVEAEK
jgi:precorrin-6Y C5,15-methyltransferase (decarboxylating) CbiT subunit